VYYVEHTKTVGSTCTCTDAPATAGGGTESIVIGQGCRVCGPKSLFAQREGRSSLSLSQERERNYTLFLCRNLGLQIEWSEMRLK